MPPPPHGHMQGCQCLHSAASPGSSGWNQGNCGVQLFIGSGRTTAAALPGMLNHSLVPVSSGEAQTHTYLIDLLDPPVNAIKGPTVGDVVHQKDSLRVRWKGVIHRDIWAHFQEKLARWAWSQFLGKARNMAQTTLQIISMAMN